MLCILSSAIELVRKKTNILWYSGLQRLFKIFDNNTGIHNMLKYKHNTFNRKITQSLFKKPFKQSNANGILPNLLNIAKLVLVLLALSIYLQK
jgi:hypothetical protein